MISTLKSENHNLPGGTVAYGGKELLVRSMGEVNSIEQLEKILISLPSGGTVYLRDFASVSDSFKKVDTYSRMNGENSIGISVYKQSKGNTLNVVNAVKKELVKLNRDYPEVDVKIVYDQGEFIEDSIRSVSDNAISGGILAIIVLLLFLGNFRTAFFIGVSIPISIIATFIMMYFAGINLNTISLGGLALGVGMLVDNSIVVLENIHRYHHQEGYGILDAARLGAGEVGGAVFASTLTTVVVFLPIVFTEGMITQIFKELSLTVTFSLLASLSVAFTLIPLLCSRYLKHNGEIHHLWGGRWLTAILAWWSNLLEKVLGLYHSMLKWVLCHRKTTLLIALGVFVFSLCLIPLIGVEFYPDSDQGLFTVDIELPQGSALGISDQITRRVEELIFQIPEIEKVFVSVGEPISMRLSSSTESHTASISVKLKSLSERKRKTAVIVDELREQIKSIPGAVIKVSEVTSTFGECPVLLWK